ncbi:type II secretion system protein M [Ferrimonas gelatinilytica]|uniref:Type II secretion system protein M n=1 Tax=Ferrimonas gelatinilytica TaxID=1255257 RepID=A0ABP9SC74_9GAMM
MNEYWEKAQQWWFDRTESERRYMTIAAPLLLLALIYYGLWVPVSDAVATAETQLRAAQSSLNQMKQDANRYTALAGKGGPRTSGGSLSQLASRSAAAAGLRIERMQPQSDKLQLWLADCEFERLMEWLSELSLDQGVRIENLDLTESQESGLVQVRRLQISKP